MSVLCTGRLYPQEIPLVRCMISGFLISRKRIVFRREADENCAALDYYAASSGNSLPTFRDRQFVPKRPSGITTCCVRARKSAVLTPGTNFCYWFSQPQCHIASGRTKSMKNPNDPIGNQTRDLPATRTSINTPTKILYKFTVSPYFTPLKISSDLNQLRWIMSTLFTQNSPSSLKVM